MGIILLVAGKVVEEMVRQETSLSNTAAESQGTCIPDLYQLDDDGVELNLKKPA